MSALPVDRSNSLAAHEAATGNVDTKSETCAAFGNDDTIGFVRVRRRKLKGGHPDWREYRAAAGAVAFSSWSFDLVRAVRVNGKPRHKFVLGLGSQKSVERFRLISFWIAAIAKMSRHGLTEPQRQRLIIEMVRKGARLPSIARCEERLREYEGKPNVWPYSLNKANLVEFMAALHMLSGGGVDTKSFPCETFGNGGGAP